MNLSSLSVSEIVHGINNNDFSVEDYISQIVDNIRQRDVKINAFVYVNDNAIDEARKIDKMNNAHERIGPLAGIAVGVKDNISTKGILTTCGSNMLKNYTPSYDATVVKRLKDDGAIIIGKLNMDEFGMGSSTEFSSHGPTRNPWNIDYVAGGSSGGSAASVAADECTISLGSDTGGSIRCPSSFCSVVGLKPTYGRVSRYGLVSYSNSFEQIGPICKSVSDVLIVMNSIAGFDNNDNTSENIPNGFAYSGEKQKIGILKDFIDGCDSNVEKHFYKSVDILTSLGYECQEIHIKDIEYALSCYYIIATAEASSNLARYDNIRYGYDLNPEGYEWNSYFNKARNMFGDEVKMRIILGTFVLSSGYYGKYYVKAQALRSLFKKELDLIFNRFDILLSPTMPVLPFKIGERIDDPLKLYLIDNNTVLANLTGIPAMSIPCGYSNGLPIGLQIMAKHFHEYQIFDVASRLENEIELSTRRCFDVR